MEKLTVKDFHNGKGYASCGLREEVTALGLKDDDIIVSFAYTDYGGDFFDKVAIEYFQQDFKDSILWENTCYYGKNGVIWGEIAKEFWEAFEKYPLGFRNIEDCYSTMQNDAENEGFKLFLDDSIRHYDFDYEEALEFLLNNRGGYYSVYPSGLDFCSSDVTEYLLKEGVFKAKVEA